MEKEEVFQELRKILKRYESNLNVIHDKEDVYYLDAGINPANKKAMFFGSVRISRSYVAFHLMPVYTNPSLLENISNDLKKRMQGKSCFNFKEIKPELFQELESLTHRGIESYKKEGYL